MRGVAPGRLHRLDPLLQTAHLHMPLPGPGPGEVDELIAAVRQVQRQAHGGGEVELQTAVVLQPGGPGQNRLAGKKGVAEIEGRLQELVLQMYGKCLRLPVRLAVGGGQPLQGRLAGRYGVGAVDKIGNAAAVGLAQLYRRMTEIRGAAGGVLLLAVLQGEGAAALKNTGGHGAAAHLQQVVKVLPVPDGLAKIELAQGAVGEHLHQIADRAVGEVKGLCVLVVVDTHGKPPGF